MAAGVPCGPPPSRQILPLLTVRSVGFGPIQLAPVPSLSNSQGPCPKAEAE